MCRALLSVWRICTAGCRIRLRDRECNMSHVQVGLVTSHKWTSHVQYIYVYIYVYMYVYICTYIYVHMYLYIHVHLHTYVHIDIHAYMHVYVQHSREFGRSSTLSCSQVLASQKIFNGTWFRAMSHAHLQKQIHVVSITYPFCGRNLFRFLFKHNLQRRANLRCFAHTLVEKAPRLSRIDTLLLAGTLFLILLRALGWSGIQGESDSRGVDGGRGVQKFLFRNHAICWVVHVSVFVWERESACVRDVSVCVCVCVCVCVVCACVCDCVFE